MKAAPDIPAARRPARRDCACSGAVSAWLLPALVATALCACSGNEDAPGGHPGDATSDGRDQSADAAPESTGIDPCAERVCEPAGPCATAACDSESGQCVPSTLPDGTACDDADLCTVDDRCSAGLCAGTQRPCAASSPCFVAFCEPASGGCLEKPLTGPSCDDSNPCTSGDACADGECLGNPMPCDDGNPCTSDSCDASGAACLHVPLDAAPCDDADSCTTQDLCVGDTCIGNPRDCDDGNPCTSHSCSRPDGDCVASPLTGIPCDDGDACTSDDACTDGLCAGALVSCDDGNPCTVDVCLPGTGCLHKTPALPCDDGNPCTHSDVCLAGECLGEPVTCHDANPCTLDSCDPASGQCLHGYVDWPCDDGTLCTSGDVCVLGVCIGLAITCDDANPCTSDSCSPLTGCTHGPANAPCDDGNACTLGDFCQAGACQPGKSAPACDDANPCTLDVCLPADGECHHSPASAPCSDDNPCTVDDHCDNGTCVAGDTDACQCSNDADCAPFEDGNKCNGTLFCDKAVLPSKCKLLPGSVIKCSTLYDTPCRKAQCQTDSGICLLSELPDGTSCNDADPCTAADHCEAGECTFSQTVSCDDGNPCTNDSCDPKKGCLWDAASLPCDDGNLCTVGDVCQGGNCIGIPVFCEDANPCTAGVCDPLSGKCSFVPVPSTCNDGNPCTTKDQCQQGVCTGQPVSCDDGLPCTEDACNLTQGCIHTPLVGECNDSDGCTAGDVCKGTKCVGVPITCFDGNPCTDDLCTAATGCVFKPNFAPCDDGDACTYGDLCKNGFCAGFAVSCDDGNTCTASACHPVAGCVTEFLDKACTDYSPCTLGDWCKKGSCIPGLPVQCDDGNLCTLDFCDPDDGKCRFEPNGLPCDDGSSCSTQDHCSNGTCTGFPVDCTDLNPCTSDSCISGLGCLHEPVDGAFCDDLDLCTQGDICNGPVCDGPLDTPCDDGNPCTADGCSPAVGCTHSKLDGPPCDDGKPDTLFDACTKGLCDGLPDPDLDGIPDQGAGAPCATGVTTDCTDNCPALANADQADTDEDGTGDLCEICGPAQIIDGQSPPDPNLWSQASTGHCPDDQTWFSAVLTQAGKPALELYAGRTADCLPAELSARLGADRNLFGKTSIVHIGYEWSSTAPAAQQGFAARLVIHDGATWLPLFEAGTQTADGDCGPERHVADADRQGQLELVFSHSSLSVTVRNNGIEVPGSPFDLSGLAPQWTLFLEAAGTSFDPLCPAHAVIRILSWEYVCP